MPLTDTAGERERGARSLASVVAVVAAPLLLSLLMVGCPSKPDEPDSTSHTASAPSAASASSSAPTADPDAGPSPDATGRFSVRERREFETKINTELCQNAAKRLNQVNGRPEFDPKGVNTIAACLELGNLAWFRCISDTQTPAGFTACSHRYLIPKDEAPL